jgi:hypothetical protein
MHANKITTANRKAINQRTNEQLVTMEEQTKIKTEDNAH